MSVYITYKNENATAFLNGKHFTLVEYKTYYYPYSYHFKNNGYKFDEDPMLRNGHNKFGRAILDRWGEEWYSLGRDLYMVYCEGEPMFDEPTAYYDACQYISKEGGLPMKDWGGYDYCYRYLNKKTYEAFNGEFVKDFPSMVKQLFNVGDRVFFVHHYDNETRIGDRYQVESMVIERIEWVGDTYMLYNNNGTCCSYGDRSREQGKCFKTIEELKERYPYTLYMWHHGGGMRIEECPSTSYYMRYLKEQCDNA